MRCVVDGFVLTWPLRWARIAEITVDLHGQELRRCVGHHAISSVPQNTHSPQSRNNSPSQQRWGVQGLTALDD